MTGLGIMGVGLGVGLLLIGVGYGIGKLAAAALEGTARQPEAAGALRNSMLIAAALIEGIAFFAIIICYMALSSAEAIAKTEAEGRKPAARTAPAEKR